MGSSWLTNHLETFVKPQLGFVPAKVNYFTDIELTLMKNLWRSAKTAAGSRPILLTGRDTFVFEVLAQREHFPTVFRPDISRATVHLIPQGTYEDFYLFDTGFVGSIANKLKMPHFGLASATQTISRQRQVFPHLTGARSLALKIEGTPKYWNVAQFIQGTFADNRDTIVQPFSDELTFARAAGVTIQVYTNSASKFLNVRRPLPYVRKKLWTA